MKRKTVDKFTFCAVFAYLLSATSMAAVANELSPSLTESGFGLSAGYFSQSGANGYFVGSEWQLSPYVQLSVNANSRLNSKRYDVEDVVTDSEYESLIEKGYEQPTSFTPRHTSIGVKMTLRYPIELSGWSVAPFVDAETLQFRTKSVELLKAGGSTSDNGDSNSSNKVADLHFERFNALAFGVGIHAEVGAHHWILGYHGYSTDESWSEVSLEDDQTGAWLRYDYFVTPQIAVRTKVDTVDIFGDPSLELGFHYHF